MRQSIRPLSILAACLLLLVNTSSAASDADLTGAVVSAFGPHTEDASLHAIAHQRVVEISAGFDPAVGIAPNFNHSGMRTAEVLAWNMGTTDPVARVVEQWRNSPDHAALLSSLTIIGCAGLYVAGAYFAACALAPFAQPVQTPVAPQPTEPPSGPFPLASTAAPLPPVELPDTAAQP